MMMFSKAVIGATAVTMALTIGVPAHAGDFDGATEAKVVWDITTGDEKVFNDRLGLIKATADGLQKRGIKPDFVLIIHGPAAKFVTRTVEGTKFQKETIAGIDKIHATMNDLAGSGGAKIEVCSIAMHRGEIKNDNVMPFAVIEDNVWENSIILQNKGYAYMPVF